MQQFVVFLRGINVGGHHKVPMAELKDLLDQLGFQNSSTLLNSGNVVCEKDGMNQNQIEQLLADELQKSFGFPIPSIVKTAESIKELIKDNPFEKVEMNKDIRLYISFLKEDIEGKNISIPYTSEDGSFNILKKENQCICSVLDLSIGKTPKAMEVLEKAYRKENLTTRNWNTLLKIVDKLD